VSTRWPLPCRRHFQDYSTHHRVVHRWRPEPIKLDLHYTKMETGVRILELASEIKRAEETCVEESPDWASAVCILAPGFTWSSLEMFIGDRHKMLVRRF